MTAHEKDIILWVFRKMLPLERLSPVEGAAVFAIIFAAQKLNCTTLSKKLMVAKILLKTAFLFALAAMQIWGKVTPKHPKGKRYTEEELRGHRDRWYAKVEKSIFETTETIYSDDIKLFHEICNVFDERIRYWLHEADLCGLQPDEIFKPLSHLLDDSRDPFFEFLNIELEKEKATLFSAIKEFIYFNSENTFPVSYLLDKNAPRIWLYRKGEMDYDLLRQNPKYQGSLDTAKKEFEQEGKRLNELASTVWNRYVEFVRLGRRILSD